jgi:hypothetical protein
LTDGWALLEEDRFDFSTSLRCFTVVRRNFIREALSKNVAEMTLELQVRPVIVITIPSSALSLALLVVVDINGVLVGFIGAP